MIFNIFEADIVNMSSSGSNNNGTTSIDDLPISNQVDGNIKLHLQEKKPFSILEYPLEYIFSDKFFIIYGSSK